MSKDENESLVKEEPPTKKKGLNEQGKNSNPLITKLTKTLQLTKHVGPTTNGELASLVDKIMREKANEDKKMELKKHENCHVIRDKGQSRCLEQFRWVSSVNWLKILKVQKSLIKRIVVVVSEVNKPMGTSEIQKEDTVSVLMDGVLLLANANQDLKCWQRERVNETTNQNKF